MYRFEEYSQKWVKAGLYYDGKDWERLNIFEIAEELGETTPIIAFIREAMQRKFI
jgi:hypothetical protein